LQRVVTAFEQQGRLRLPPNGTQFVAEEDGSPGGGRVEELASHSDRRERVDDELRSVIAGVMLCAPEIEVSCVGGVQLQRRSGIPFESVGRAVLNFPGKSADTIAGTLQKFPHVVAEPQRFQVDGAFDGKLLACLAEVHQLR